jgi:predicted TIM-barrel fold metal-dependent hydrolase
LILDAHVHVGKWRAPVLAHTSATVDDLNEVFTQVGISGAVVTATDRQLNAKLLDDIARDGRLRYWVFPWLSPGGKAGDDLAFAQANRHRIAGIKLHPSFSRVRVTEPAYAPLVAFAERERLPVLIHCGQWVEVAGFQFALELAERHPKTDFILAHGGGNNAALRLQAAEQIERLGNPPNVYLDLTGLGLWWAAEIAVEKLGAHKFLYGSDFPLGHPKVLLGLIDALRIPAGEKDLILGQNLLQLLES